MNYKYIISVIFFLFTVGCNQNSQKEKLILISSDQKYKNTGFTLIYNDNLKKKK